MSPEEAVETRIGYTFSRREGLVRALTHRSHASAVDTNNERLEFLGDAVLDLAISELLMDRHPAIPEGELSRLRAALVNQRALAERGREAAIGAALRLGRGEERSGGREKESLLAAAYEALLGAVFLDGGYSQARGVVARGFARELELMTPGSLVDYKTRLQELTQERFQTTPSYQLVASRGPDHAKAFVTEIRIAGAVWGRGEGRTKKASEQEAALCALERLEAEPATATEGRNGSPGDGPRGRR